MIHLAKKFSHISLNHGKSVRFTSLKKQSFKNSNPYLKNYKFYSTDLLNEPRDSDETDVLIVGGGPSGLSAAIKIKQLAQETGQDIRVCLLEKGASIG